MSEPNAEQIITAAKRRRVRSAAGEPTLERAIQPVTFQAKQPAEVADDDPRVANLMRLGLGEVEARRLVSEVGW